MNGERNGEWKKYYNNKLVFEGEYYYNCRFKGKEYLNEKLEFCGEYLF